MHTASLRALSAKEVNCGRRATGALRVPTLLLVLGCCLQHLRATEALQLTATARSDSVRVTGRTLPTVDGVAFQWSGSWMAHSGGVQTHKGVHIERLELHDYRRG